MLGSFDGADHDVELIDGHARDARDGERAARHQVPPPPGRRPRSARACASAAPRRCDGLVEAIELPEPALRARRAVAPRGRCDEPRRRRAGRGGAARMRTPERPSPSAHSRRRAPRGDAPAWGAEARSYTRPRAAVDGSQSNRLGGRRGGRRRAARCASASKAPPVVTAGGRLRRAARAVRGGAPLAHARRRRVRACRCGPTWRPTSRRTTTPTRRSGACTSTTRSSPTACSGWASCRRVRLQRALARVGPDGAEWRALDRVLVWAHWVWFMVPHGIARCTSCCATRALPARGGDDLRGVRHRRERLLAAAHRAARGMRGAAAATSALGRTTRRAESRCGA